MHQLERAVAFDVGSSRIRIGRIQFGDAACDTVKGQPVAPAALTDGIVNTRGDKCVIGSRALDGDIIAHEGDGHVSPGCQ